MASTSYTLCIIFVISCFPAVETGTGPNINLADFKGKVDIVFVIDDSASISEHDEGGEKAWNNLITFVTEMVRKIPVGPEAAQIGFVRYSSTVEEIIFLNQLATQEQVISAVENLKHNGGNTYTAEAIRVVREEIFTPENGHRTNARKILVLITDGMSNINASQTVPQARKAKAAGIQIFTIGVTDYVNMDELQEISSDPIWYHYFLSPDYSYLNVLQEQLISRVVESTVPAVARCNAKADIAFVLDNSGSIRQKNPKDQSYDNWDLLKKFVIEVIDSLDVASNMTRVAVIKYAEKSELVFHLNQHSNTVDMKNDVARMEYLSGGTNTSGAIRLMRKDVFKYMNGDRPGIRNIGIVISDGESTVAENLTKPEAKAAKDQNITMFSLALTNSIDEPELMAIASKPTEKYYFNSTDIASVGTLINRLVINLCDKNCPLAPTGSEIQFQSTQAGGGTSVDTSGCPKIERPDICKNGADLTWKKYEGHLIVGHNYLRLPYVGSAAECQKVCLQDPKCRSIDYAPGRQECAIAHTAKDIVPDSYGTDPASDYFELFCAGEEEDKKPTTPAGEYVNIPTNVPKDIVIKRHTTPRPKPPQTIATTPRLDAFTGTATHPAPSAVLWTVVTLLVVSHLGWH